MICIHVQDHADFREKAEKAVGVLTCFCDKSLRISNTDIAVDGRKDTANTDGRIAVTLKKDVGNHGSCGCFAMGTGNRNRCVVVAHDLSKKLCTCEHWKTFLSGAGEFRVVRMDGCCVYNNIYIILDIGSALSIVNHCTALLQCAGKRAGFCIGAGDPEILFKKNLCKAAHADAADSDKMNVKRFMKVYLIHNNLLIYVCCFRDSLICFIIPRPESIEKWYFRRKKWFCADYKSSQKISSKNVEIYQKNRKND